LLREVNPDASLIVFAGYLDLEQRLSLFEAGVDDCVCEPFFASEMAVRLQPFDTAASGSVGV
jgi:DNA-binding response OmpR family regulator